MLCKLGFTALEKQINSVSTFIQGSMKKVGLHLENLDQRLGNIEQAMAQMMSQLASLRRGQMDIYLKDDLEDFQILQNMEKKLIQMTKNNASSLRILGYFNPRFQDTLQRSDRLRVNFGTHLQKLVNCVECGGRPAATVFFHDGVAARCYAFDILFITSLHRRQFYTMQDQLDTFEQDLKLYKDLINQLKLGPWIQLSLPHLAEFVQHPELYKEHPHILESLNQVREQLKSPSLEDQHGALRELAKLGRAAFPLANEVLPLLSPNETVISLGSSSSVIADETGQLIVTENKKDYEDMSNAKWYIDRHYLRFANNASKYNGACVGGAVEGWGAEDIPVKAILLPSNDFCAFVQPVDKEMLRGQMFYLREPRTGKLLGYNNSEIDYFGVFRSPKNVSGELVFDTQDRWREFTSGGDDRKFAFLPISGSFCVRALEVLKIMGLPEESREKVEALANKEGNPFLATCVEKAKKILEARS